MADPAGSHTLDEDMAAGRAGKRRIARTDDAVQMD
jgi:hypothetical protein